MYRGNYAHICFSLVQAFSKVENLHVVGWVWGSGRESTHSPMCLWKVGEGVLPVTTTTPTPKCQGTVGSFREVVIEASSMSWLGN